MLLLVTTALAWSHRGHLWEDHTFPLRVCAEAGLEDSTARAIGEWHRATRREWFTLDCSEPDVMVGFDHDDAGPLAVFQLMPETVAIDACDYENISRGWAEVRFSGMIEWAEPVGTGVGQCEGNELQTRLLQRYLGVVLGLDSSASGSAMAALDSCDPVSVSWDESAGLAALYGAQSCSGESPEAPSSAPSATGCRTAPGLGLLGLVILPFVRRKR